MADTSVLSSVFSGLSNIWGGNRAAKTQERWANNAINEQRGALSNFNNLLNPYGNAGNTALAAFLGLTGLSGEGNQQTAINNITSGAGYQSELNQGINAINQNASASGGLRGGNTQMAVGQFAPQLLQAYIDKQLGNYSGLVNTGYNANVNMGNAGLNTASSIGDIMQNIGKVKAGNMLNQANNIGQIGSDILSSGSGSGSGNGFLDAISQFLMK